MRPATRTPQPAQEPHGPRRTLIFLFALAGATLGASGWFLLRPSRPLYEVEDCWRAYRAVHSRMDTLEVDRRRVRVTPTMPSGAPREQQPFTCGAWREFGTGPLRAPAY